MKTSARVLSMLMVFGMVLAVVPVFGQGQVSGLIRGTVSDSQGGVMPGVTVITRSESLIGGQKVAITNEQGTYRFPSLAPGIYELEAQLDGFQPVLQQNVVVSLGKSIEMDLVLGDITISDEIVVIADSVQVNTISNSTDFNLGTVFIERQPVARNPTDLMNYAPGIQNDQAYGAPSTYQNAFNMDGIDVSDPELGSQWVLPSMDWVQEVQVAGLGADAEYGGFTGAVVNVVTKSGGNQFHGDVRAYYSGGSLNSDNAPPGVEGTNKLDSDIDVSASVGGAIIQDSLWYFVSANRRDIDVQPFYADNAPIDDRANNTEENTRILGKLSWQASNSNKLVFLLDSDDKKEDYRGVGNLTLASNAARQDSPNFVYSLGWESVIGNSNFVTAKITGYSGSDDRLPYNGDIPGRLDRESRFRWDNLNSTSKKDVERVSVDASWSLFADGLLAANDSHNFKFGLVYEDFSVDWTTRRNGGFTYYDDSWNCGDDDTDPDEQLGIYFNDPFCGVFSSDWGGEWDLHGKMDGLHFFAQDAWKVGRFAVNAGVRYSKYTGSFASGGNVYDQDLWSPRLGFVWDVAGNGKAAIKLHYGRYYEGMTATLYDREVSGNAQSDLEYFDYNSDTGEFDLPAGGSVTATAEMDPGIGHPYVDQYVATFEYQIASQMLVGIDYINRKNHNINAMITANVDDYDPQVAPNSLYNGEDVPFFDLLAPNENLITNPKEATRNYESVALRVQKRYAKGWTLDGSLVWSDLTGNADYGVSGYGTGFDDLNGFVNADGKLPFNSEWVFKVSASVDLPWRTLLSGFYQYRTGEYWTPYAQFDGLFYNNRTDIFIAERGSEQYDDRSVLDLKFQKDIALGSAMSLALFVDVFNVLDSDKVTAVEEQWGYYDYVWNDHPDGSEWDNASFFMDPLDIQNPRTIRFGAKFAW